jgi:hypothetical protein
MRFWFAGYHFHPWRERLSIDPSPKKEDLDLKKLQGGLKNIK